jgi:hypothetical protein
MTERRDDQGYAVSPVSLDGSGSRGPGRSLKLGALVALGIGTVIVAVGWIGPRLNERPRFDVSFFAPPMPDATATPAPTPTPVRPNGPTPLPALTRSDDAALTGRIGVWTETFQVLDLGAGSVSSGTAASLGQDAVIPVPDGNGWLCICLSDRPLPTLEVERDIQIVRLGPDGSELSRRTLTTISGLSSEDGETGVQADIAIAPDQRSALLVAGHRSRTGWDYAAWRIDLAGQSIGPELPIGHVDLPGRPALPTPAPGATPPVVHTNVSGPTVRRSPDGRLAFVWETTYQGTDESMLSTTVRGWRISLDANGEPVSAGPADGLNQLPPFCSGVGFIREDRLAAVCGVFPPDPGPGGDPGGWWLFEFGPDGSKVAESRLPETLNWYAEPLFDTANGLIWLWDVMGLNLHRIDAADLGVSSVKLDPLAETMAGTQSFVVGPARWVRPRSSVNQSGEALLAGAPDGSRLYLLGLGAPDGSSTDSPPSLGVFVVDPRTLAVIDRWAPDALYVGIEPVLGGRALALSGAAGLDARGGNAPWDASVTIHDAADGRILLRFGRLGQAYNPQVVGS